MSRRIALCTAVLLGCLPCDAIKGQSPPVVGARMLVHADVQLALATAIGRSLEGGNYPDAGVQTLRLGLTRGPVGFYSEVGRWVAPRGREICPSWAGPCARIVPLRSFGAGLSLSPGPRARVAPYLAGSLGILSWDREEERFNNPAYAVSLGLRFRVSGRLALGFEASRRKLISGPLYLGDRIGYYAVGLGIRYFRPLRSGEVNR